MLMVTTLFDHSAHLEIASTLHDHVVILALSARSPMEGRFDNTAPRLLDEVGKVLNIYFCKGKVCSKAEFVVLDPHYCT